MLTEPQETAPAAQPSRRRLPWWAGALALVLTLAVGVGIGFLAFGRDTTSMAVDPQIVEFIDDYEAAWNAGDADAIRAMATDDAYLAGRDVATTGALSLDAYVDEWWGEDGLRYERLGLLVNDVGGVVFTASVGRLSFGTGDESEAMFIGRLVREDTAYGGDTIQGDGTLKAEWDLLLNEEYEGIRQCGL